MLSTLPWEHALVDARRLAEAVTRPIPAPRVSHDFAYFPLGPAQLGTIDGIVFLRRAVRLKKLG
ncbi:hypothetical protein [Nonomuraea fuscirosea]|uniref:hypothetical protein n=1 Tax=Nonomuraea fuscirosea TaxID=1291556 RepID=UPI003432419F